MKATRIFQKISPAKLVLVLGLATTPFLTACTQTEADKIADAQYCLDRSTSDDALSCLSKIDGLTSASAEQVRCSAYFVDQGFSSAARIVDIYNQIESDNGNSSGDSTIAALSFMAFSASKYSMDQNFSLSETAFTSCVNSKSAGLVYLSSMTRIATATLKALNSYDPTSGTPPTQAEIEAALNCGGGGPPAETAIIIGSAAQIAYEMNCKNKTEPDPVCEQYAAAVSAGNSAEQIGSELASNLCP